MFDYCFGSFFGGCALPVNTFFIDLVAFPLLISLFLLLLCSNLLPLDPPTNQGAGELRTSAHPLGRNGIFPLLWLRQYRIRPLSRTRRHFDAHGAGGMQR